MLRHPREVQTEYSGEYKEAFTSPDSVMRKLFINSMIASTYDSMSIVIYSSIDLIAINFHSLSITVVNAVIAPSLNAISSVDLDL